LADSASYFFTDPTEYEEKAAKKQFNSEAAERLLLITKEIDKIDDFTQTKLEELYRNISEKQGLNIGNLIHPTRLAISGTSAGPGLFEMMEVIGKDKVLKRILKAIEKINNHQ
jgi:glutamyl-tRNA synthetase